MGTKPKTVVVHIAKWHTNWIIGAIFREAAESCAIKPSWRVYPTSMKDILYPSVIKGKLIPYIGELNIYTHQDTYFLAFAGHPEKVKFSRNRVYFTHFNNAHNLNETQISALAYCERILVQNKYMGDYLISTGISSDLIARIPGAVNREIFKPSQDIPKKKYVLFTGHFKYRKNPELIGEVITSMPDIDFVIHGQNWKIFPPEILNGLPNLEKMDFSLEKQPKLMRQASLYVSLALIEGGPYTVLEALASGTPVVATDTGFCAEFINGANGILLPNPPKVSEVQESIRKGLRLKQSVWGQDLLDGQWQWKDLGRLIYF